MNSLITKIKNEQSIYMLSAIAYACDNAGKISCDSDVFKNIISKYLIGKISVKAKTPQNTMRTILFYTQKPLMYFTLNNNTLSLKDSKGLQKLKDNVINQLESCSKPMMLTDVSQNMSPPEKPNILNKDYSKMPTHHIKHIWTKVYVDTNIDEEAYYDLQKKLEKNSDGNVFLEYYQIDNFDTECEITLDNAQDLVDLAVVRGLDPVNVFIICYKNIDHMVVKVEERIPFSKKDEKDWLREKKEFENKYKKEWGKYYKELAKYDIWKAKRDLVKAEERLASIKS